MKRHLAALVIVTACGVTACGRDASAPANFELHCDSSDTATESRLFCMRLDTRSGEVVRVNHTALPQTSGTSPGPSGSYALACDATTTTTRSDLYCIRLDRRSGEMVLLALPALPVIPPASR